jgi:hypothetical protein
MAAAVAEAAGATLQRTAGEAARLPAAVPLVLPARLLAVLLARLWVRLLTSVSLVPLARLLWQRLQERSTCWCWARGRGTSLGATMAAAVA